MNFLFAHNNFPAQFRNLASALAANPSACREGDRRRQLAGLPGRHDRALPASGTAKWARPIPSRAILKWNVDGPSRCCSQQAPWLRRASSRIWCSRIVDGAKTCRSERCFPNSKIAIYSEFYFRADGQDVHFDPEAPRLGADGIVTLQCRNAATLLALAEADLGISPTHWQRSTYPKELQAKIKVAHEGIDVERASPNPSRDRADPFGISSCASLTKSSPMSRRNLERPRGYHIFMRSLKTVLKASVRTRMSSSSATTRPPTDLRPRPARHGKKSSCIENADDLDLSPHSLHGAGADTTSIFPCFKSRRCTSI